MSNIMSDPNNGSAIKVTPELEAAIAKATSTSEIISLMHQSAIEQGLVESTGMLERDRADWFLHRPVQAASTPAAKGVARTVVIDGVKHVLEAADEAGLVKAETELYRAALAKTPSTDQQRDSQGRFVAQQTQAEIDAEAAEATRLAGIDPVTSTLVKSALEAQGVDMGALKEFTAQKRGERHAAEWASAGEEFRRGAGQDWPGGAESMKLMGELLLTNSLDTVEGMDAKVKALEEVWQFIQKENLLADLPEAKAAAAVKAEAEAIQNAQTPEELRNLLRAKGHLQPINSSLWGR